MKLAPQAIAALQTSVWDHYNANKRDMPWREHLDPYWIMVSEIMLQQTQVERVRPKFEAFIAAFPTVPVLAAAPLSAVVQQWVGLGYNRRAKFLHAAAKEIVERYNGKIPNTVEELASLPGIGSNTAGAIVVYAFNCPVVFVETNVRTVLIHQFFRNHHQVDEKDIRDAAGQVLDSARPREWYWALMDYGAFLKKTRGNNIAKAKIYRKQSAFQGSFRQARGKVIALLAEGPRTVAELEEEVSDSRLPQVLLQLSRENLIIQQENHVQLAV